MKKSIFFFITLFFVLAAEASQSVTATWSIENGAVVENFTSVSVTFAGVDAQGRTLDATAGMSVISKNTHVMFYSVGENETLIPVETNNELYSGMFDYSRDGLTLTFTSIFDRDLDDVNEYPLVDGAFAKKGNYRIVLAPGMVQFLPNIDGVKVFNEQEFVLNFTIENSYAEEETLEEVVADFTAVPENNKTLKEIREVVLTFADVTSIALSEVGETPNPTTWVFCNQIVEGVEDEYGMPSQNQVVPTAPMLCEVDGNKLILTIASEYMDGGLEAITAEGNYTITIPAGLIIFGEKRVNKAITLNYVVEKSVTAVENIIADALYVQNGEVVFDGDMQIFTVTGKNVTNMNGRLDKGVYVVKTIDFATKIVVK